MWIADAHADSLMWNRDLTRRSEGGHVDFPRLKEAGVRLQCFTVVTRGFPWVGGFRAFAALRGWPRPARKSEWARAVWQIDRLWEQCAKSEGEAAVVTRSSALEAQDARGGLSAILGVEGAHALEGQVDRVRQLHRRGVRFMGLTHLSNNPLGGSSYPLMGNRALTSHGREVLDAMAEVGMAVDVAHASSATLEGVLQHPRARPFCSHTGVRGAGGGWRSLPDEVLRQIAARGGVVGILFGTVYLGGRSLDDVVRHIEHALRTAGEDAVCFGSDFDGFVPLPRGMRDVRDLPRLVEALERRHPARVVEKVAGLNLRRFFSDLLVEQ